MNVPPKAFTRVPAEAMRGFITTAFEKVGVSAEDAGFLARLLVTNDLRGVFSHGTRQAATYVGLFRDGTLNPRPRVEVVSDTPSTALVDGDGSLGYFAAYRAATLAAEKAAVTGIAAAVSRNHGHIGAAGIYSRIPVERGLVGYCTSGHQLHLQPGQPLNAAAGGSPMSFAAPAGDGPPLVLDFGAMHDLYPGNPHREKIFELAPAMVFRSIGLGAFCQVLGGFLAGVPADPARAQPTYPGANQGSLTIALDVGRFLPREQFTREVEEFVRAASALQPMPGYERAYLPGGPEWEREQEWSRDGIPIGERHRTALETMARELGIAPPFIP
jgi:LDH2 family malate/lactate/ureidoglycolate dehydrogenase